MAEPQPVFRFAPSPNGYLHLGHAASALLNASLAKRLGGRLLLRIEDIDIGRSRPEFEAAIVEDLAWLGLRFDEPARRQSEHMAEYAAALQELGRRGLTYPCFCTRGEIAARVAEAEAPGRSWPRDPDGAPMGVCPCAGLSLADRQGRIRAGEPHATRLAMAAALEAAGDAPLGWTEWDPASDGGRHVEADPARWGDVVIGRKDVPASYHLAVTHDDALQGVTHVVRGADLREATHIHVLLQRLRGLPTPVYHHHGLVLDADGRKLSKSIRSTALRSLRAEGVTPGEIRRRLGALIA
ncbi:tRNA glutamyl-Q(34) synthetase GluQRS [Alsobacter soli]|uniref:tRNA glutamyl-Q(34) synthetase GluQRS n=1 Tax=Alsobacter soli TaxID=2109933 RepID=A0A2T1HTX6_9HYPH|nr:tRNA glutamyl-Q(34) synthetase GluQRS [Alsobacter soli]PSC05068.1 tRNA glutamyl-Q(34) synthetase GluQRS [Alsobacter soli]